MTGVNVTVEFTKSSGEIVVLAGETDAEGLFIGEWLRGLGTGLHRGEVVGLHFDGQPIDSALDPSINDEDWDFDGAPDESLVIP